MFVSDKRLLAEQSFFHALAVAEEANAAVQPMAASKVSISTQSTCRLAVSVGSALFCEFITGFGHGSSQSFYLGFRVER